MRLRRGPRLALLAAGVTMALFASACGGSDDGAADGSTGTGAGDTITVEGIAFPKPEKTKVTIGAGAVDPGVIPLYLIDSQNLDEQFGFDLELVKFSGTSQVTQAMLTGQVDVANGSGGIAMATQGTGRPAKIAYVTSDVLTDMIITRPDVATAADLKGKAIAISSYGSQSHAGAKLGIQALGLTEQDVTITQVGNDAARLAALKGGSVAGAVLSAQVEKELTDAGYHVLQRLTDVKTGGYALTSLTVPEKFAEENPNTVLALVAMYTMGRKIGITDKEAAAKAWATEAEVSMDQARADVEVELSIPQHPLDGRCAPEMIEFVKEIAASSDDKIKSVNAQDACTNEYVDKLKEMGFQKAIGVEGY
jgi:ABC-type nitrate/sulfonate/bicarbonate transport system substrate-binding protein